MAQFPQSVALGGGEALGIEAVALVQLERDPEFA
jgi:hypothetical protein